MRRASFVAGWISDFVRIHAAQCGYKTILNRQIPVAKSGAQSRIARECVLVRRQAGGTAGHAREHYESAALTAELRAPRLRNILF